MTDLIPQAPAEGIYQRSPFPGSRSFFVPCICSDPDHEMHIDVEYNRDYNSVDVTLYTRQTTDYWSTVLKPRYDIEHTFLQDLHWHLVGLYNNLATRLRMTRDIWLRGHVTYQATTCMNLQQAHNFSSALVGAMHEVKEEKQ